MEDDPRIRRIITKILTSCGMLVRAASDGIEALEAFNQSRSEPDLLCADIIMPRMDGKELVKRLRQQGIGVPVIFVSGTIQKAQEGYRPKSHIWLVAKPFGAGQLAEIAKEMVAKPRPQLGPRLTPPAPAPPGSATEGTALPPAPQGPVRGFDSGEFPAFRLPGQ